MSQGSRDGSAVSSVESQSNGAISSGPTRSSSSLASDTSASSVGTTSHAVETAPCSISTAVHNTTTDSTTDSTTTTNDSNSSTTDSPRNSGSNDLLPRLVSGSVGSIITALAVTPLDVVKVRQQAQQQAMSSTPPSSSSASASSSSSASASASTAGGSSRVTCPRGCGTFVLNNGIMDCVLPRSAVPYFDPQSGRYCAKLSMEAVSTPPSSSTASMIGRGIGSNSGSNTFTMIRRIFVQEGLSGIYAGLGPTLVMSVPNAVLYYTTYDEISTTLRRLRTQQQHDRSNPYLEAFVSGSLARLLASTATAPLELIRTRQAALVGSMSSLETSKSSHGLQRESTWQQLRGLTKHRGIGGLYQGLVPTLWRDVPFSAIYWMFLESFKRHLWPEDDRPSPVEEAGRSFVNGALAGLVAAGATTPFDVVKTRQQTMMQHSTHLPTDSVAPVSSSSSRTTTTASATKATCLESGSRTKNPSLLSMMRGIVREEGVGGLWRGNMARMMKVAPACAIMITCYEFGKRILTQDRDRYYENDDHNKNNDRRN